MKQDNNIAISVKDVCKSFKIFYDRAYSIKEALLFSNRRRSELHKVLCGVSFDVRKGEAVGLIGHNGCGKSTMLKLLTRIMYPDSGSISINGRVSSLIELGAGFHPDMSGRENIYINASIFGLTKKEIDQRLDDIIAFSELGEYIDNPIRTYSSGMYMRLAFSVAINVDADILLIDEILAVGDTNFQVKCFNHLRELKAKGVTIILVTHDMSSVERICDKAIWINNGVIEKSGASYEVVDAYHQYMNRKRLDNETVLQAPSAPAENPPVETPAAPEVTEVPEAAEAPETIQVSEAAEECGAQEAAPAGESAPEETAPEAIDMSANRFGLKYIEINEARMINGSGSNTRVFETGQSLRIEMDYIIHKPLDEYVFGFGFYTIEGECIYGNNTQLDRLCFTTDKDRGSIAVDIEKLPLLAGRYKLNVAVVDKNGTPMDFYRCYCEFDVVSEDRSCGYLTVPHNWRIEE